MKKLNEMTTLWDDRPTADSRLGGREGEDNRHTGWLRMAASNRHADVKRTLRHQKSTPCLSATLSSVCTFLPGATGQQASHPNEPG